jgi:hypothetical protein
MEMDHTHSGCTGNWSLEGAFVACSVCGRRYLASPRIRMAAVDENLAGELLNRLTARGKELLSADEE